MTNGIEKALEYYVALFAACFEIEREKLAEVLDGYYELRRACEEQELTQRITPPAIAAEATVAALKAYTAHAGRLRVDVDELAPEPPAETQVSQDAFEAVPPPCADARYGGR